MKKILNLPTVVLFLITILIAGGCGPANDPDLLENLDEVTIKVKAIKVNGDNHLEMYDSNDPKNVVIDDLETFVKDGTKVFWMLADSSGLKKIRKIRPKDEDGDIITKNATGIWFLTKYKKYKVPDNQTSDDMEGYIVEVKDKDNNKWGIDPYLRIP